MIAMDSFWLRTTRCFTLQGSCKGEVNECHNGGTMIWDPVKPLTCVCKDGYIGMFCEKGIIHLY